jgi:hypothetical protein
MGLLAILRCVTKVLYFFYYYYFLELLKLSIETTAFRMIVLENRLNLSLRENANANIEKGRFYIQAQSLQKPSAK